MSQQENEESTAHLAELRAQVRRLGEENALWRSIAANTDGGRCMLQRETELNLVKEVAAAVLVEQDMQNVLDLVARAVRELIHAETVVIPMIDEDRTAYTYAAAVGKHAEEILGSRLGLDIGMCGWVLTHQRALLFGHSNEWLTDAARTPWEEGMESAVLVPLFARQRIIGGISALGKTGGGSFSQHDLDLLTLLASHVSSAIENARLVQQANQLVATLEQRVSERTAEMTALNKELEAFAYSVSHDLRAPIRSIDGFSLALLEDYGEHLDPEAQDYLSRIRGATVRMGRLIDDMLKLSRLSRAELHRERIDLSATARRIAAELAAREPERRVEFRIADHLSADGDPALLGYLMENLLANAWKYTSNHATALIEFGVLDDPRADIGTSDGARTFFVRDDGAGFDMTYSAKLFGAFQRLHTAQQFPGTGVGLASVQRIINRHGGRIWAEGAPEKGARFFFTLADIPRPELAEPPAAAHSIHAPSPIAHRIGGGGPTNQ
ncbi:MAG: GAF domain-containing protein [Sulfuritalea sp.]|nr:GAF domain-containing protein [Sulfuritalea sp.]MDP1985325.1 GAF domain-containing protein [Sulfuritalea sp.]